MAVLLVIMTFLSGLGTQYAGIISDFLGKNSGAVAEEIAFPSEFGEFNEASQTKLVEASWQQTIHEMEEGAVLLRNENGALPLKPEERSITIFGRASVDPVYKNHSAGNHPDPERAETVTLQEAFTDGGFSLNTTLLDAYTASEVKRDLSVGSIGEVPGSFYTAELKASWSSDYQDAAIIFITRESSEGDDFFMKDADGISQLALHDSEREMIEMVTSSKQFGKVIVLLNTPTPMELDWLEEYSIDACLWIGTPGTVGFTGTVNLLTGQVNPSGRLVDTYASNSLSAPATISSGTNSPVYLNAEHIASSVKDPAKSVSYLTVHPEGIYVGYKYYETRYEDTILNQGNASAPAGASYGAKTWNYADEMTFPFGYGLSYTTFRQTLDSVKDNGDGTMTAAVTVTNTGDAAGKSVVQLYAQTPYGEYEKQNLVEKAAIQLIQFGKTGLLEPGESETVELEVDKYLLASYDYTKAKTYILSEGSYYLAVGDDCHDALNNILAAKGAAGMTDADGNPVAGDASKTYTWTEAFDGVTYSTSQTTGYPITNRFDDCDLNSWVEGAVTYISRQDWAGTYPSGIITVNATEDMIHGLSGDTYVKPADAPSASQIPQGQKAGLYLTDMKGVDYHDEKWETYLSQMTVEELASQLPDGFGTVAVPAVRKPETSTGDGIDGLNGRLPYGSRPYCNTYCAKVLLTSTWNTELYQRRGELMGEEALFRGMVCAYTVGGDIHLTPFGGRNFEYMSEDGVMAYLAAIPETEGYLNKGVNPAIKHFAGNDQEYMREGISTFFNEQFFREIDLRAFEGCIRVGGSNALMQGLHRLGVTYDPAHYGLNTEVLRNEWGFTGIAETDGTAGSTHKQHFEESLTAGTSVYCLDTGNKSRAVIKKEIQDNDDGYLLLALRRAVKDYHYTLINGCGANTIPANGQITGGIPWFLVAAYAITAVFGLATVFCCWMFIREKYGLNRKKKGGEQA